MMPKDSFSCNGFGPLSQWPAAAPPKSQRLRANFRLAAQPGPGGGTET